MDLFNIGSQKQLPRAGAPLSSRNDKGLLKTQLKLDTYKNNLLKACQSHLRAILKALFDDIENNRHDSQKSPERKQELKEFRAIIQ